MLVPVVTVPVAALMVKPAVEEYVPPEVPENVAFTVPELTQYGDPAYEIVELVAAVLTLVYAVEVQPKDVA